MCSDFVTEKLSALKSFHLIVPKIATAQKLSDWRPEISDRKHSPR
jgi:hypothetical protein